MLLSIVVCGGKINDSLLSQSTPPPNSQPANVCPAAVCSAERRWHTGVRPASAAGGEAASTGDAPAGYYRPDRDESIIAVQRRAGHIYRTGTCIRLFVLD